MPARYEGIMAARHATFAIACGAVAMPAEIRDIVEQAFYAGACSMWNEVGRANEVGPIDGQARLDALREEIFGYAEARALG